MGNTTDPAPPGVRPDATLDAAPPEFLADRAVLATSLGPDRVLALQRTAGNVAVNRLVAHDRVLLRQEAPSAERSMELRRRTIAELDHMDGVRSRFLLREDIDTEPKLRQLLTRWQNARAQVTGWIDELARPGGDTGTSEIARYRRRLREAYEDAVRIMVARAATALGQTVQEIITREESLIEPDARDAALEYGAADRFERLHPDQSPEAILEDLNPAVENVYCTQNCPATAQALQDYLMSGTVTPGTCDPDSEPPGYIIDARWSAAMDLPDARQFINQRTPRHGSFVVVEGDRGDPPPSGLTQWHYFVILRIHDERFVVDGYLRTVSADLDGYAERLQTRAYRVARGHFEARPVTP
jgi:hypothetical protein